VARRHEEAVREFRNVLVLHPDDTAALAFLGLELLAIGDSKESVRMLERAVALSNRTAFFLGMLAYAYAHDHRRPEAEQIVEELQRRRKVDYVTPGAFVYAFSGLGDDDAVLASLEEAYAERANIMKWLKVGTVFDPLRTDPRFQDLVRRVGLD
jgi:predicted Zn-dependent protease